MFRSSSALVAGLVTVATTAALLVAAAPAPAAAVTPLLPSSSSSSGGVAGVVVQSSSLVEDGVGDVCGGLPRVVPGLSLCTHGEDVAPAARSRSRAGGPVPTAASECIGDGRSGQRVSVLHVRRSGAAAPSASVLRGVRRWVGQVEWTVQASARRLGGARMVRWRTDADCRVEVATPTVSADALGDLRTMVEELRAQGFRRSDRSYLLFVEADRYCGIATAPRDDAASDNRADRTSGYARVDRPCWDAGDRGYHSIAAHELFHTLGAVQASAPNGTSGAHCNDEHDLLCYDDGTSSGTRTVCRDGDSGTEGAGDANDRLLDCRGDDYFNPAPRRGSYLATHWNTADSRRLYDPEARRDRSSGGGSGGGSASGGKGSGGKGGGNGARPSSPTRDPLGTALRLLFGT